MSDDAYISGPPEAVSPDDPIVHGLRWRRERDRYCEALEAIVERGYLGDPWGHWSIARAALGQDDG